MLRRERRELLRLNGRHRAHVRNDRALCRAREHTVRAAQDAAYNRTVRHHCDHHVRTRRRLLRRRRRLCTRRRHLLHGVRHNIEHRDRKARLQQIPHHGLAHNPETDKTDLLHHLLLPSKDYFS